MGELKIIPVSDLRPDPDQPRKHFDEKVILDLAESLKAIGCQVPLLVVADEETENQGSMK